MSKREKDYPDWVVSSSRQWKQRKRRQWRSVQKAIQQFNLGSAYTPAHRDGSFPQIERLVRQITDSLSIAKWGR